MKKMSSKKAEEKKKIPLEKTSDIGDSF